MNIDWWMHSCDLPSISCCPFVGNDRSTFNLGAGLEPRCNVRPVSLDVGTTLQCAVAREHLGLGSDGPGRFRIFKELVSVWQWQWARINQTIWFLTLESSTQCWAYIVSTSRVCWDFFKMPRCLYFRRFRQHNKRPVCKSVKTERVFFINMGNKSDVDVPMIK